MDPIKDKTPPLYQFISEKEAERKKALLPSEEKISSLATFFKIFGDVTRLRILFHLLESKLSVGDLAALTGMTDSAISHQLKQLKSINLVYCRRHGRTQFYSLADQHVADILKIGLEHVSE